MAWTSMKRVKVCEVGAVEGARDRETVTQGHYNTTLV
jgi:hypothetical protein